MEEFIFFHDSTNMILFFIILFVGRILISILTNKIIFKGLLHGQILECIWTTLPGLILIQIALPSLSLLYLIEDSPNPNYTIKAVGHQWYWEYEYTDFWFFQDSLRFSFDSYIIPESELEVGIFRQLETDNRAALPAFRKIRILVTSADVLHSWTIPSLGVKVDAIPGRINQLNFIRSITGVFYGQCSEICGSQHSNIPICIELLNLKDFHIWALSNIETCN